MEPSSINLCVPKKSIARKAPALETLIYEIRGEKIILDSDLARIYGVATKAFNQAVKRNADKFPEDFMFRLTAQEARRLQRSRSQFVTLKRGQNIKYLPYAFTEHGAIMAANVLNSPLAVQMSAFVVRAFLKSRWLSGDNPPGKQLASLEKLKATRCSELSSSRFCSIWTSSILNLPAPSPKPQVDSIPNRKPCDTALPSDLRPAPDL
jgi:hypothetical protein